MATGATRTTASATGPWSGSARPRRRTRRAPRDRRRSQVYPWVSWHSPAGLRAAAARFGLEVLHVADDVAGALTRLGVAHVVEGATDDGLFRVDCLLADRAIAVEADGPSHFVGRSPNGPTRLRRRLLEARGLRIVSVPFFEWDAFGTDGAKDAYVAGLLK